MRHLHHPLLFCQLHPVFCGPLPVAVSLKLLQFCNWINQNKLKIQLNFHSFMEFICTLNLNKSTGVYELMPAESSIRAIAFNIWVPFQVLVLIHKYLVSEYKLSTISCTSSHTWCRKVHKKTIVLDKKVRYNQNIQQMNKMSRCLQVFHL